METCGGTGSKFVVRSECVFVAVRYSYADQAVQSGGVSGSTSMLTFDGDVHLLHGEVLAGHRFCLARVQATVEHLVQLAYD
jgi:hypothetical protein